VIDLALMTGESSLSILCGQLVIGGFEGTEVPSSFARALAAGERGGAILFRRNLTGEPRQAARLNATLRDASMPRMPPLIAIDQEGGRVARLGPPLLVVPAMRTLAARGDEALVELTARAQAEELSALGFTMNFAPVLDVNTCEGNPIIGDRAFGDDPGVVAALGLAYARGLALGGMLACGKHFPGHGDTSKDSHLELPIVDRDRARLDAVELAPFRAAARAALPALMTAHVMYPALDPALPATLSRAICTDLLRGELGYEGWLVSDDLEMKGVADTFAIEDSAVRAITAGCDAILVCRDEALQARAHEALVHAAEADDAFRDRCREAAQRGLTLRRRVPPRPLDGAGFERAGARAREVAARLAAPSPVEGV
jgi:beta-N-acetylhexosaminidase